MIFIGQAKNQNLFWTDIKVRKSHKQCSRKQHLMLSLLGSKPIRAKQNLYYGNQHGQELCSISYC